LKKLSAIFAVLVIMFAASNIYSQAQVVLHVTGGYDLPMSQLKGDATVATDLQNTYVMKSGWNAGADGKYYLGKKRNVGITLSLGYHSFSSGDVTPANGTPGYTFRDKINSFTAGLGIEYAFLPKGKANPFIGAEFTGNFFSGKAYVTSPTTTDSVAGTLTSASRFGVQFNGGVDIMFSKSIGAVIGVKYNLANLIGKKYDSTSTTAGEFPLNDAANGSGTYTARNIGWLQLYAGVSFYFNRPKTMMKK
jgi:outer membrane protein W